jgi:hypothetical protein
MRLFAIAVFLCAWVHGGVALAKERAGWSLATCEGSESSGSAASAEAQIRAAAPGTNLWVPHPFSTVQSEIVENVLARHSAAFGDLSVAELPTGDARLFDLARKGQLGSAIVRVADWTPLRCEKSERRYAYWLVRFFDSNRDEEIARVLARDSGLISRVRHATAEYSFPSLPDLRVPREFTAELGEVNLGSAQYVTTWGPDPCDAMTPCVAWRLGSGVALLKGGKLFLVSGNSERLSFTGDLSNLRAGQAAARVAGDGKELLSLGGDLFVAAGVVRKDPSIRSEAKN